MKVFFVLFFLLIVFGEYLEGYYLDVFFLKSLKDVGLCFCCKECLVYMNCWFVNYNKNDFFCELNYYYLFGLFGKIVFNEFVYMDRVYCFILVFCSVVSK